MNNLKIIITVMATVVLYACGNNAISQEIKIGTQTWAVKNLDVSTFRNGDTIPNANTEAAWVKAGYQHKPAWCYWNNNPANGKKYGMLYNWYAVNDPRGLAPMAGMCPAIQNGQL